jgi:dTDP-4-dehydrorhamnose 3,5-epimerase-like enzyme
MNGPRLIELEAKVDDRGFLYQVYERTPDLPDVKRIYVVGNFSKGMIRGFHRHEKEWKLFFVARGSVKMVVVRKDRQGAPKIWTYVLTTKRPGLLVVPPGNHNGWMSLEDDSLLIGLSTHTLEESLQDDFRVSPQEFGDVWEVKPR